MSKESVPTAAQYFFLGSLWISIMLTVQAMPCIALSEQAITNPHANNKVLILSGGAYGVPFSDGVIKGIVDELLRNQVSVNDIFVEHIDLNRNSGTAFLNNTANSLHYKYAQHKIGLIITLNRHILSSLVKNGKELLPGIPVIAFGNGNEQNPPNDAGHPTIELDTSKNVGGTLQYALTLFPETKRLFVVNSTGKLKQLTKEEIARSIHEVLPKLQTEFTEDLTYEQMLAKVGSLPADSIVFCGLYSHDASGRTFIPVEVATEVVRRANAPVFGIDEIQIIKGLLGGSVVSAPMVGKRAGELALDYLKGHIVFNQTNTKYQIPYTPLFNWQQVERWKADISRLPQNTVFYNRPRTFWQQYKKLTVGVAVVLFIQSTLILSLMIQNRLRKRAEQMVEKERQRLSGIIRGTRVGTWEWNVQTGDVRVNDLWLEIIGYTREELLTLSFDAWATFVHPDDLQPRSDKLNEHFTGKINYYQLELRLKHKDGHWKWVLSRGKVLSWTNDGKPHVMMGTHQDITELKLATETIKQSESRLVKLVDILQHSAENTQELLDYSLDQIINLTGSKIGYIYHYDEDHKRFVLNSWSRQVLPACAVVNPQTCHELEKTGIWGERSPATAYDT